MPADDAQVRLDARPCNFDCTRLSQISNQIIIVGFHVGISRRWCCSTSRNQCDMKRTIETINHEFWVCHFSFVQFIIVNSQTFASSDIDCEYGSRLLYPENRQWVEIRIQMFIHHTSISEDIWLLNLWLHIWSNKRKTFSDLSVLMLLLLARTMFFVCQFQICIQNHELKLQFRLIIISIKQLYPNCNSTENAFA